MRKNLIVIAALMLVLVPAFAVAKDQPQQYFSNAGRPSNEIQLTPVFGGVESEETLSYDGPNNDAIGLTAGGTYIGAVRFTPTFTCSVKALLFYQYHNSNNEKGYLWSAGSSSQPGARIDSATYNGADTFVWKRVDFPTAPIVSANTDFWVGPQITHASGRYPLGVDAGPMVPTRGGFIYYNGSWTTLQAVGLDYNWNIRAIVAPFALGHDVGVTRVAPVGRIRPGQSADIVGVVKNFGLSSETFDVHFVMFDSTNSVDVLDTLVNVTVNTGDTLLLNVGSVTPATGDVYHLTVTTMLAGDENPPNDELVGRSACRVGSDPDGFGYIYESSQEQDSVTYNWIDPTGGTPLSLADDAYAPITLPFDFPYYGQTLTTLNVCSNGFLSTSTATAYTNAALPQSTIPNFIGLFWDDLNPAGGGQVLVKNSPSNDYTVVAFVNVPPYSGTGTVTAQVVLDNQGRIRTTYQGVPSIVNSNTMGIQGMTGSSNWYLQYCFNGTPANHVPAASTTVLYYYPPYLGVTEGTKPVVVKSAVSLTSPYTRNVIDLSARLGKGTVQVYDLTGQVLKTAQVTGRDAQLSLDGLNAGLYFVKVNTSAANEIQKLVLVR